MAHAGPGWHVQGQAGTGRARLGRAGPGRHEQGQAGMSRGQAGMSRARVLWYACTVSIHMGWNILPHSTGQTQD